MQNDEDHDLQHMYRLLPVRLSQAGAIQPSGSTHQQVKLVQQHLQHCCTAIVASGQQLDTCKCNFRTSVWDCSSCCDNASHGQYCPTQCHGQKNTPAPPDNALKHTTPVPALCLAERCVHVTLASVAWYSYDASALNGCPAC